MEPPGTGEVDVESSTGGEEGMNPAIEEQIKMEQEEAINIAQKVVALDARYNAHRPLPHQHRMLYIRRRNQLLQDNAKNSDEPSIRKSYLQLRTRLLATRYGPADRRSNRSTSRRSSMVHSLRQSVESLHLPDSHRSTPQRGRSTGLVPTRAAQASRAMAGDTTLAEYYAFCGMHHLFDVHKDAVMVVRFAHDDKTRLASASLDGSISVFNLTSEPPSLSATLRGHTKAINDFDWSAANDFIVSASSDGTCRLWNPSTGVCLREIHDGSSRTLCCRFHPHNNNFVVLGNSKAQVKLFNVSTGKAIKGGAGKTAGAVLCLAFNSTGSQLWAGDSKGSIYMFEVDVTSARLQRLKRIVASPGYMVTSISYRTWVNREARDPSLLVSCADSTLRLFRILPDGGVYLKRRFTVPHATQPVRSAFCPLMSFRQGACVVSGSEDKSVYFFDVETGSLVNKLQGHSSAVIAVCWAYDESLLASCDTDGTVIVWKRGENDSQ